MDKFSFLIIDDREENIYSLKMIIEDAFSNVEIYEATNVDDALVIIMKQNINLILSDVQMPEVDGFDLIKYLKEIEHTKDIPVILISGIYEDSKYIKKAYELGAVDYITKPIDDEILCSKLKVYIDLYSTKNTKNSELSEKEQLLFEQVKINSMLEGLDKYNKKLEAYEDFLNEDDADIDIEQIMRDKQRIDELMQ